MLQRLQKSWTRFVAWLSDRLEGRRKYRLRLAKLMHYTAQTEEVALKWREMYDQEKRRRELYEKGSECLKKEIEGYQFLLSEEAQGLRQDPWKGVNLRAKARWPRDV